MRTYVWTVKLDCGHDATIEKVVPGPPGEPVRCFEHGDQLQLSRIVEGSFDIRFDEDR